MLIVKVCVGSSCHLKGSEKVVNLMKNKIEENHLEDQVVLVGSFCSGNCTRSGITVTVNDDVYTGVTAENFSDFWQDKIEGALKEGKGI